TGGTSSAGTGGTSAAGAAGGGAAGAAGAEAGAEAGPPITVTGQALEFTLSDAGSPPIVGMTVCVHEHPEVQCATTDSTGLFVLPGVPSGSELLLSFEKASYFPVLRTITTGAVDVDI